MSETFTRRADRVGGAATGAWVASVIPLAIGGIWWRPAWALILFGLFAIWLFATCAVYDPRYEKRYSRLWQP